jgi:hypothetical protein
MTPAQAILSPHLAFTPEFRRELSDAFCQLYFLPPHSIVRSRIEQRPLERYISREAYSKAIPLYTTPQGPHRDLLRCQALVSNLRTSNP